jgi:hypothetical protein
MGGNVAYSSYLVKPSVDTLLAAYPHAFVDMYNVATGFQNFF